MVVKVVSVNMIYLLRSHCRPVVVVLADGSPMGMRPQCGPSTDDCIWISWWRVLGRSWIKQSSDRRTIRTLEKRWRTLMFPTSWSNLPPSAPETRILNYNTEHASVRQRTQLNQSDEPNKRSIVGILSRPVQKWQTLRNGMCLAKDNWWGSLQYTCTDIIHQVGATMKHDRAQIPPYWCTTCQKNW